MKKNTHPFLIETKIQLKDGAMYKKRWLFFRSNLPLEMDIKTQSLWQKDILIVNKNKTFKK